MGAKISLAERKLNYALGVAERLALSALEHRRIEEYGPRYKTTLSTGQADWLIGALEEAKKAGAHVDEQNLRSDTHSFSLVRPVTSRQRHTLYFHSRDVAY